MPFLSRSGYWYIINFNILSSVNWGSIMMPEVAVSPYPIVCIHGVVVTTLVVYHLVRAVFSSIYEVTCQMSLHKLS